MDKVVIEGLVCQARVGVPEQERAQPQKLLLDLELGLDLSRAGQDDRVEQTVDYAAVCAEVKKWVEGRPFKLVEAVAQRTAELVLEKFLVEEVKVRVRKFSVLGTASVGVEITRLQRRGR